MKIYIIGGPGSGKTSYARQLSQRFHVPHFDLDEINWVNTNGQFYGQKRDKQERAELLASLTNQPDWIIEGAYFQEWITPIWEKADKVIVLECPCIIRQYRCIKRFIFRKLRHENTAHQETFSSFYRLLLWNSQYDKSLRQFVERIKQAGIPYEVVGN